MTVTNQKKWDKRFLNLAFTISDWSKDRSTKTGAVVVGDKKEIRSMGYNGLPRGVNDDIEERHERPLKYSYFEHAERNAIYNACFTGTMLDGCTMYVTTPPCCDCARAIIQAGIKRVVSTSNMGGEKGKADAASCKSNWRHSCEDSIKMFKEAGVTLDIIEN